MDEAVTIGYFVASTKDKEFFVDFEFVIIFSVINSV